MSFAKSHEVYRGSRHYQNVSRYVISVFLAQRHLAPAT